MNTILDCYTDEPAGLGVPPYLGTYPRYIAGYLGGEVNYLTIDDLRFWKKYNFRRKVPKASEKSDIYTYNLTNNADRVKEILEKTDTLFVILGVHVPGKYLSAMPGTLHELAPLLEGLSCRKILTGPAVFGTQLHGGKTFEKASLEVFDKVDPSLYGFSYETVTDFAVRGASLLSQIPDLRMMEIETGKGCDIGRCSFCTEPLKSRVEFRKNEDILREIASLYAAGARYFRLGKQTCFYTIPFAAELLKSIRESCPGIKVLHIDNCNPVKVMIDHKKNGDRITKAIVQYCTSGNVAAFGIESFDLAVVRDNTLNTLPQVGYDAIKAINHLGSERGPDGLPRFIPGINIIFGLRGETKKTHEENMRWLKKAYDEGLFLRRINIRKAALFEGTSLHKDPGKAMRKNQRWYWKWRNDIRQHIDFPMLQRLVPKGSVIRECYAEIYDGNTTFCRQFGTYPLIVGVKGRLPLKEFFDLKVTGHMLRSVTGEVVQ
ncbi:radical SAM protein [Candidatus Woesearchaeota archaeon]|nr:radical SAM protein [Candidatus Woesearchaeota archaeon]